MLVIHLLNLTIVLHLNSMWNNVINAWWPLLFYAASDAPRFRKGMIAMICTCVATLGATALVWALERREGEGGMQAGCRGVGAGLEDEGDVHVRSSGESVHREKAFD